MIRKLFNNPHVLYQTPSEDEVIAEPAIAISLPAGGLICLEQEGRQINLNKDSIPELCKLLKKLAE